MTTKEANRNNGGWRGWVRGPILSGLLVGLLFYLSARLGMALLLGVQGVPSFHPATGLLLGALACLDPRRWALIIIWVVPAGLLAVRQHGLSFEFGLVWTILRISEGVLGAWLFLHLTGWARQMNRFKELAGLMFVALLSAFLVPPLATPLLALFSPLAAPRWWAHGVADFLGMVLTASVVLSYWGNGKEWLLSMGGRRRVEFSLMAGGFLLVSFLIFFGVFRQTGLHDSAYLTFPFLAWAALRFGMIGASTLSLVLAIVAFWCTASDLGPFTNLTDSIAQRIFSVQVFLLIGSIFSMAVAALMSERVQAEVALRSSEDRFRSLAQNQMFVEMAQQVAHIGSWYSDPYDLEHLNWSPEVFRIFGLYEPQWDRRIQSFFNLVHPEDLERVRQASQDALSKGIPYSLDHRIIRPDGLVRWVHEEAIIIRDEKGRPKQKVGVVQDITERKRNEEARRQSEEKYRSIWQNDVFALCLLDAESLHYVEVNSAYARLYGYGPEEFPQGLGFERVCADPESGRLIFRRTLSAAVLHLPMQLHQRKNGTVFPVEITGGAFEWNGRKLITLVTRDITEHQRLEEAQRIFQAERDELLERMELQMERMPVACVLLDPQFRITYWNAEAERIFGFLRHEVMGKQPYETIIPEDLTGHVQGIQARLAEGAMNAHGLHENLTKHGRRIFCEWHNTPLRKPDGAMVGFMCMAKDVTDRVKAEAEVRKLNAVLEERVASRTAALTAAVKELEAFSYSISHDLRAPLRSVHGFATILLEDYGSQLPKEAQEYLRIVHQSALQMGHMIDDLLTFSRLGRQALDKKILNPRIIVTQVLEDLQAEFKDRQVQIQLGDLPECSADPSLIRHVWTNLLSNALKYTRRQNPAIISVGSRLENGCVIYYVKDNGAGFDMKYAEKLFGVFQRLHRAEDYEGTGVGLAIVHRIIDRHDGRVWAEAAPDQGATFYFSLPVKPAC